jgi:oxalate decarboxylase/phosphoglucose isomerase-like protein (cupin superfamily)
LPILRPRRRGGTADRDDGSTRWTHSPEPPRTPSPGCPDRPANAQDEFYIIARGHGTLLCADEPHPCAPGDLLFVPRGMDHRFIDFSDDFATWVIFVPDKADPDSV